MVTVVVTAGVVTVVVTGVVTVVVTGVVTVVVIGVVTVTGTVTVLVTVLVLTGHACLPVIAPTPPPINKEAKRAARYLLKMK
jgi:hypothetical protein